MGRDSYHHGLVIFVSYASEDSGFASKLERELQARGLEVWFD
jgi:hypothetical protein